MNFLGWSISIRRKQNVATSAFTWVLPRVRSMREQRDWPPTTTPAAQEQRRERVEQARRRIVYRPEPYEPYETASEPARPFSISGPTWTRLLWYGVPFALLAAALAWVMLTTDSDPRIQSAPRALTHPLPGTPTFLTENLALAKAEESLAQVVGDPSAWQPELMRDSKIRTAPDGTPDVYLIRMPNDPNSGVLMFTNGQEPNSLWTVTVQLRGAQVDCTVSRTR